MHGIDVVTDLDGIRRHVSFYLTVPEDNDYALPSPDSVLVDVDLNSTTGVATVTFDAENVGPYTTALYSVLFDANGPFTIASVTATEMVPPGSLPADNPRLPRFPGFTGGIFQSLGSPRGHGGRLYPRSDRRRLRVDERKFGPGAHYRLRLRLHGDWWFPGGFPSTA